MNLPESYNRVCSVRPEARYEGLYPPDTKDSKWTSDGKGYVVPAELTEKDAESIIIAHWLTLLKPYHMLHKDLNGEWAIVVLDGMRYLAHGATRIDVLEAYLLGETR